MNATRRHAIGSFALVALAAASALGTALPAAAHDDDDDGWRSGMVFTSSNDPASNELLIYATKAMVR